ncbi:MAG: hypothetical protein IJ581_07495 [Paludibacteraceae bacterium]|nr:hypothetical protein [Paludibacteraceae bacterium]
MLLTLLLSIIVSAQIDSATIMLGDQTDLHLQAVCLEGEQVSMPIYGNTLAPDIEIVDRTIVDTTRLSDGRIQMDQYLTLTSFKDSLFYISPLPFVSGSGDTIWSNSLSLNVVQPFELDSMQDTLSDIKPIWRAPIWWWGIIRWILLALLLTGVGVGVYYLVTYLMKKESGAEASESSEPLRPAEEVALEKLEAIRATKIWQQGRVKEYHTELTDVVREYIARRFGVSSAEKTSDETLLEIKPLLTEQKEQYESLRRMLQLADLVKFAKWTTTADENEQSLQSAYTFVKETTPAEAEADEADFTTTESKVES